MNSNLRSSEIASESEIRRAKERDESLKGGFKTAAKVGGAISGAGLSARILPFLSEYITPDLAIKGISKISPDLGKFLKKGMEKGLNVKDGLNYIKENLMQSETKKEPPKQSLNIIEQESPELHQFLLSKIKEGLTPVQAATLAQNDKKFIQPINRLKNKHKVNWSAIIETVFGKEGEAVNKKTIANDIMNPPGSMPTRPPSAEQQAFTQQSTNQSQPGQGQQMLMSLLQKLNQQRGTK